MALENSWLKEVEIIHWLFLHKRLFRRLFIILLILFNVIVWGIFFYYLVLYIIYTPAHRMMLFELTEDRIDFIAYHQQIAIRPLIVTNTTAIFLSHDARGNRYSFVAEVKNPNEIWFAKIVSYNFVWDGGQTEIKKSFFSPGEEKYLISLNEISSILPTNLSLEIRDINWQRVRPEHREKLKIIKEFSFQVTNFTPAIELEGKILPASLRFEVENSSAYSFKNVEVFIAIYRGEKIINFDTVVIKSWLRGEKRTINLNLTNPVSFLTEIKIVPQLNLLEPTVFAAP